MSCHTCSKVIFIQSKAFSQKVAKEFLSKESRLNKTSLMGMMLELGCKKAATGNVKKYFDSIIDSSTFVLSVRF